MLPRPQGQSDILRHLVRGREFVADVMERRQGLLAADASEQSLPPARPAVAGDSAPAPIHLLR
jgi:hypothetical protein